MWSYKKINFFTRNISLRTHTRRKSRRKLRPACLSATRFYVDGESEGDGALDWLYRTILGFLRLSLDTSSNIPLSWAILVYLRISQDISGNLCYFRLFLTISDYFLLSAAFLGYFKLSLAILGYPRLYAVIPLSFYPRLTRVISGCVRLSPDIWGYLMLSQ